MNKLIDELRKDTVVKRYIYLRNIIDSNDKYLKLLKSDLSLNEAKTSNSYEESIVNEYLECEKMVKNDIDLISSIINTGLNINFLD
ncbi:MAG: hypothetical protein K6E87_02345 [bacterium]|nr:hypothetical protein [bacterium]